jgi:CRP/FNR family transcriptional regulator
MEARAANPFCCGKGQSCEECEVRALAVCGALSAEELPRLAAIAVRRELKAGHTLFEEGDAAEEVFTLTSGMIKLYKLMSDGRRQITGFLVASDFLGLAFGRSYVYSAEAVVDSTVCRFRRSAFLKLLEDFPAMEKSLLDRTSTELAAAQEQILLLGRKSARERVASFLLGLCVRQHIGQRGSLRLPMSRIDIADFVGLTIETVSRTLSRLRREGVIDLPDTHRVVIASWGRLQQAAGI